MIIVGNLKMNFSLNEIIEYEKKLEGSNIIICPSFPFLSYFKQNGYYTCAQNVSEYDNGPYTGDVSFSQLKSLNVNYSLVGHSERRHVFNESQESLDNKVIKLIDNDMKVIYCIGETRLEKENNETFDVLNKQLTSVFSKIDLNKVDNIIIGYEPVWAISDGVNPVNPPSNEEIDEVNKYIKKLLKDKFNVEVKILYGGSVNLNNIRELVEVKSHDGFLIGGASKNVDNLLEISAISNSN